MDLDLNWINIGLSLDWTPSFSPTNHCTPVPVVGTSHFSNFSEMKFPLLISISNETLRERGLIRLVEHEGEAYKNDDDSEGR